MNIKQFTNIIYILRKDTVTAKEHLRTSTRQWLWEEFVSMTWVLSANVKKVTLIHISEPKKNLVSQDQVMSQTSDFKTCNIANSLHN